MQDSSQRQEPQTSDTSAASPPPMSPLGESQAVGHADNGSQPQSESNEANDFMKEFAQANEILNCTKAVKELLSVGYFPGSVARKLPQAMWYAEQLVEAAKRTFSELQTQGKKLAKRSAK